MIKPYSDTKRPNPQSYYGERHTILRAIAASDCSCVSCIATREHSVGASTKIACCVNLKSATLNECDDCVQFFQYGREPL